MEFSMVDCRGSIASDPDYYSDKRPRASLDLGKEAGSRTDEF
jgi:hypothetical protein